MTTTGQPMRYGDRWHPSRADAARQLAAEIDAALNNDRIV
jgi:Cft2 family RNA processing exonuclease